MLYAVMDIETTGLDVEKDHIIEICMKHLDSDLDSKINTFIYTKRPSHSKALAVHGITLSMLKTAPTMREIADQIIDFLTHPNEQIVLIAQNGFEFDFPMLQLAFQRLNKTLPSNVTFADSYRIMMDKFGFPFGKSKLIDMFKRHCPQLYKSKAITAHRAEGDVDMLIHIIKSLKELNEYDDFLKRARQSSDDYLNC